MLVENFQRVEGHKANQNHPGLPNGPNLKCQNFQNGTERHKHSFFKRLKYKLHLSF